MVSGCLGLGVVLESGFLFFEFFFEKDDSFRSCFCDLFTGDADKADHYNGLLTSYRESTAAAEAASVVGGANVTETVENKFDLM